MQTSSQDYQPSTKNLRQKRDILQMILSVIIVIALSAGAGFYGGYLVGKREGARLAVKKVTDFINPFNAISDNPLFPSTVLGKITQINATSIQVQLANKSQKTIIVTDRTQVTKASKTLTIKDVKKGDQVTVLTTGKDSNQTATRIVLR